MIVAATEFVRGMLWVFIIDGGVYTSPAVGCWARSTQQPEHEREDL
jgi:hypothetical protein